MELLTRRAAPVLPLWHYFTAPHSTPSLLVLLWCLWTFATLAHVVTSKRLLTESGLSSLEVSVAELAIGTCAVLSHAALSSWGKQAHAPLQPTVVTAVLASHPAHAWLLAALHAGGTWAALHAVYALPVPLLQSMKATETLMTAAGSMLLLGSAHQPNAVQVAMLFGISVSLALATGASLVGEQWRVMAVALSGSLCVVMRNVLSKRFPLEGYALVAWMTVGGLICVLPLYALHLASVGIGGLLATTLLLRPVAQLMGLTGLLHWLYNTISCVVLSMVSQPTTHSVIKAAQRAAVVAGTLVYYPHETSFKALAGIVLALAFSAGYTLGNSAGAPPKGATSKAACCALPMDCSARSGLIAFVVAAVTMVALTLCPGCIWGVRFHSGMLRTRHSTAQLLEQSHTVEPVATAPLTRVPAGPCRQRLSVYYWRLHKRGLGGNFGDEVNKDILTWITGAQSEADVKFVSSSSRGGGNLFAVGSNMNKLTSPSDVVWGTGALGVKDFRKEKTPSKVVGVRGPLTASAMHQESPESYASVPVLGDPALLLPLVWSHLHRAEPRQTTPDQWGYVSMFHAGRVCESDMRDWNLQATSSPDKRADSTVDNTEDVSLLTPSWCVLCPGKLGDFGEFMANLEYHGGMESVIFFHRSAGVDDSAVWCSALGDDKKSLFTAPLTDRMRRR